MAETINNTQAATSTLFLGHNGEWWDFSLILAVIFAALAAVAVGVATAGSIISHSREAAAAEAALEAFKLTTEGRVADAKKEGIEAGKAAGDALLRAASLEKKAAELKAENLALEAKIAPRRLSGAERDRFITALASVPKPPMTAVVSRLLDSEGADFADDLASSLNAAGWTARRYKNWTMSLKGAFVATVEGTTVERSDPSIAGLERALATAGVAVASMTVPAASKATMDPYFEPNVLYLLVGAKP